MIRSNKVGIGVLWWVVIGISQAIGQQVVIAEGDWSKPVSDTRGYAIRGRLTRSRASPRLRQLHVWDRRGYVNHVAEPLSETQNISYPRGFQMKNAGSQAPSTIDGYIAAFPDDVQEILQKIRNIIKDAAPEAVEEIKYCIPTFVMNGNLVHFAAFQKHIGFYPTPSGIEKFQEALSVYKNAKGSVQFPLDAAIPYSLIKKIVKFRVQENKAKPTKKQTKRK